jgi:hypothetical protein
MTADERELLMLIAQYLRLVVPSVAARHIADVVERIEHEVARG